MKAEYADGCSRGRECGPRCVPIAHKRHTGCKNVNTYSGFAGRDGSIRYHVYVGSGAKTIYGFKHDDYLRL